MIGAMSLLNVGVDAGCANTERPQAHQQSTMSTRAALQRMR
jgi:hypothetical protein